MDNSAKKGGRSRLAPPSLRQDALSAQARARQEHSQTPQAPLQDVAARRRAHSEPTEKPMTGSERRAAKRQEKAEISAATKIQRAFRAHQVRKGLKAASPDLQESIKGNTPAKLMKLVGDSYAADGLVRTTAAPVTRASGRLAGDWSGGVDTQKGHLETARLADPSSKRDAIGTTHHTVSDHFLGFVDEGVKRLESGSATEKSAAARFRTQVSTDSLYAPQGVPATAAEQATRHEKALFQVRQNLTYGPGSDFIKGDPGIGFDATFASTGRKTGLQRDWDARTTAVRPVHNMAMLLKSQGYELTDKGADHMTAQLQKSRAAHDSLMQGQTYQTSALQTVKVPNPAWDPRRSQAGVKKEISQQVNVTTTHDQTIPVHGVNSGHFESTPIVRASGATVSGFRKKKWV